MLLWQDYGFVCGELRGVVEEELAVGHLLEGFLGFDLLGEFRLLVLLVGLLNKLVELLLLLLAIKA